MTHLEYDVLKREIEAGALAPVYFLFGEETYLIDALVRTIIEKGTEPATKDFNCDVLQGEEVDGETVVGLASSFPMMADGRVVVVKSAQKLSPSGKRRIADYVRAPLASTCLVLTAGKVDRRQSFYSALTKHSRWVECKVLYENQAVAWVQQRLREKGVSVSQEGIFFLVQQVGTSLWSLSNEVEKLLTFSWGKKQVGLEDVAAVVGFSRQFNTWELADSVGRRALEDALAVAKRLMEEGQSSVGLVVVLTHRIFLLMKIRGMIDEGISSEEIARVLNLRPYFLTLYTEQARRFKTEELEAAVEALLRADVQVKTGYAKPDVSMTLLVHDIVRGQRVRRFREIS